MEISDDKCTIVLNEKYDTTSISMNKEMIQVNDFPTNKNTINIDKQKFINYLFEMNSNLNDYYYDKFIVSKTIANYLNQIPKKKNKEEKKKLAIKIFRYIFDNELILQYDNFKKAVYLKIKELFDDFNQEESKTLVYLYLGLFHLDSIKENKNNLINKPNNSYHINDNKLVDKKEDYLDFYLDNY